MSPLATLPPPFEYLKPGDRLEVRGTDTGPAPDSSAGSGT
jgi:hypothetical protein